MKNMSFMQDLYTTATITMWTVFPESIRISPNVTLPNEEKKMMFLSCRAHLKISGGTTYHRRSASKVENGTLSTFGKTKSISVLSTPCQAGETFQQKHIWKKRSRADDARIFVVNDHLKMMMMASRPPPLDGDL